jgi:hypothetical protein
MLLGNTASHDLCQKGATVVGCGWNNPNLTLKSMHGDTSNTNSCEPVPMLLA